MCKELDPITSLSCSRVTSPYLVPTVWGEAYTGLCVQVRPVGTVGTDERDGPDCGSTVLSGDEDNETRHN